MTYQDPTELLGEAPPALSFGTVGETVRGTIVNMTTSQQRAYNPDGVGDPLYWPDGRPRLQVVITLQLSRAPDDPHDGLRRLFVKVGSQMSTAIKDAVRAAGRPSPAVGGHLKITYIGDEPSRGGGNPKKIYGADYFPPDGGAQARTVAVQQALQGEGF